MEDKVGREKDTKKKVGKVMCVGVLVCVCGCVCVCVQ